MTAPDGSVTVPRTVPLLMDCESAGKALRKQAMYNLPKLNFILSLPKKIDYCPREVPSGMARLACCASGPIRKIPRAGRGDWEALGKGAAMRRILPAREGHPGPHASIELPAR